MTVNQTSNADIHLNAHKCVVIVSSCDAYSDLWAPYFNLKEKFWPDCPFKTILISESKRQDIVGVDIYNTGHDLTWSTMLINTVRYADVPYILLTMEDFFLRSTIDSAEVMGLLHYVMDHNIDMLRLIPRPRPDSNLAAQINLADIPFGTNYRASGQAAFWNSSVLIDLLDKSESLWSFEVNATLRSGKYHNFQSVIKPVLTYKHHVIEKGKWFPWSAWKFSRMKVGVDLEARQVMSVFETFSWIIHKTFAPFWMKLPNVMRRSIKSILSK